MMHWFDSCCIQRKTRVFQDKTICTCSKMCDFSGRNGLIIFSRQIKLFSLWTLIIGLSDYIASKYETMEAQRSQCFVERLNERSQGYDRWPIISLDRYQSGGVTGAFVGIGCPLAVSNEIGIWNMIRSWCVGFWLWLRMPYFKIRSDIQVWNHL